MAISSEPAARGASVPLPLDGPVLELSRRYLNEPGRAAPFYPDVPDVGDLPRLLTARRERPHSHAEIPLDVVDYQRSIGAPQAAVDAAESLADPRTVVVATGQGPGLFLGPAMVVYKALTAIRLCRTWAEAYPDVRFVPLFWIASEDHDVSELAHVDFLRGTKRVRIRIPLEDDGRPIGARVPGPDAERGVRELLGSLPDDPRTDRLRDLVAYPEGETWGRWFARILARLLGDRGLVAIEPDTVRVAAPDLLARTVEFSGRIRKGLADQRERLRAEGLKPAVDLGDGLPLFELREGRRERITTAGPDLAEVVRAHPERFTTDVLTRTALQNDALPVVAQVCGPSEIAYYAQAAVVHETLRIPLPILLPRFSATLLEPRQAAVAERFGVAPADLIPLSGDLSEIIDDHRVSEIEARIAGAREAVAAAMEGLRSGAEDPDGGLANVFRKSADRVDREMERLGRKVSDAALRASGKDPADLEALVAVVRPGGTMQERAVSLLPFLYAHGEGLLDRLEGIADPSPEHRVIRL